MPNPDSYQHSRIKPRLSDNDELKGHDWLQELIDGARRRGMTTGAELSHTWLDKERAADEFADCVQRDIHGRRFDQQICFNHPDVRTYGIALYVDLAAHYDIDYVQTCVRGFNPGRPTGPSGVPFASNELQRLVGITLGGCFCEHCRAAAEKRGLNWNAIEERLRWLADGYERYHARQAFDLNLLFHS